MEITPYRTRIHCEDCGHEFTIRSKTPGACPRCWHRNLTIMPHEVDKMQEKKSRACGEFDSMRRKLVSK